MTGLVLGLDLGGSGCRAVLADVAGRRLGHGHGGPANPCSTAPDLAAAAMSDALTGALAGVAPATIRAGVLGMAGSAALSDPDVRQTFESVWTDVGLRCPMQLRHDCDIAFAAGTPSPSGSLLMAGTGSTAAGIEQRRVATRSGGHGWLLGDEGSGFWLGREVVRTALTALQRGRTTNGLLDEVLDDVLAGAPRDPDPLVALDAATGAVYRDPPIRLARYATTVCAAADRGDPVAEALVARSAALLADAVLPLCRPGLPVVLAGSLLTASVVGVRARQALADAGVAGVHTAGDSAAAAAWLAALSTGMSDPADVHSRLVGP